MEQSQGQAIYIKNQHNSNETEEAQVDKGQRENADREGYTETK
jgi:hypothetical protein